MKKNGFTLVELLAVLVIIGIISAISISVYTNSIVSSKNALSNVQINNIKEAARTYVAINTIGFNNLFDTMTTESENCVALRIDVLVKEGLIKKDVVDPKDTNTNLDGFIKVKYDSTNSQYIYDYVSKENYENKKCIYKYIVDSDEVKEVKE